MSRLYLRLSEVDKSLVRELKEIDPISFCYVMAKLQIPIKENEAKAILHATEGDEKFGLVIWSLGRLGLWNVLKYAQRRLPQIESNKYAILEQRFGV